jgi:hypothetical protein
MILPRMKVKLRDGIGVARVERVASSVAILTPGETSRSSPHTHV